jgi:hypothetical protein
MKNKTLVTHKNLFVENKLKIKENFKLGEKFFVQLKVNFERDTEYLVYDKKRALEMLYQLNCCF